FLWAALILFELSPGSLNDGRNFPYRWFRGGVTVLRPRLSDPGRGRPVRCLRLPGSLPLACRRVRRPVAEFAVIAPPCRSQCGLVISRPAGFGAQHLDDRTDLRLV